MVDRDLATTQKCDRMEAYLESHGGRPPKHRSLDPEEMKLRKQWDDLVRRLTGPIGHATKPCEKKLRQPHAARVESIQQRMLTSPCADPSTADDVPPGDAKAAQCDEHISATSPLYSSASSNLCVAQVKRRQADLPYNESPKRQRTSTSDSHSNAVTLCLRGLNIQWPFSQLILLGAKTDEVRGYDLGHRKICSKDQEVWIVETKGPSIKDAAQAAQAIVGDLHIGSRPAAAQIVGTVSFSKSCLYRDQQAFHDAKDRHRIAIGSQKDWDGTRERYWWRVGKVRSLATPVPVQRTGQTGFSERSYSVVFAAPTGDDHNDCRPSAKEGSRGGPNGQEASASSSSSVGNNGAAGHRAPFQRQAKKL